MLHASPADWYDPHAKTSSIGKYTTTQFCEAPPRNNVLQGAFIIGMGCSQLVRLRLCKGRWSHSRAPPSSAVPLWFRLVYGFLLKGPYAR